MALPLVASPGLFLAFMKLSKSLSACSIKRTGGVTKAIARKTAASAKTAFLCINNLK